MQPLNLMTVAQEAGRETDLVQVVDDVQIFFPEEAWYEIRYLGDLNVEYDLEILEDGKALRAFLFKKLIQRFREVKDSRGLAGLLLGVTPKPVVDMYHSFEGGTLRKTMFFVHDYVSKKIGVVSLFKLPENSLHKVMAHGLGHHQGLRHHLEPSDLMHSELLRLPYLEVEGFCSECRHALERNHTS